VDGIYGPVFLFSGRFGVTMDDESKKTKLRTLIMVVVSTIGSMALLGYLSIRYLPADGTSVYTTGTFRGGQAASAPVNRSRANWADDTGVPAHHAVKTEYVLHKDIQKQIGGSLVTYRGKAHGSKIKIDVVVLDLDPDFTYQNTIDISRAKQSFRAGDERFELISAGSLRLRVWHHP
jgi:hypothetical protein